MKRLTTYISHVKDLHSLNEYLNERLVVNQRFDERLIINKNYKQPNYKHAHKLTPQAFKELRQIIEDRYNKLGPGTKQKPIDFNDIDVSKIDSFYDGDIGLFETLKFEYIDVSNWDVSKVKNMFSIFRSCENLKSVGDLSGWNVSNVENMGRMFFRCKTLLSVGDLSKWDVSRVENIKSMFFNCKQLKSVGDLSDWNVSKVEYMASMFYGCYNLKSVGNLSNWDVSKVNDMFLMFKHSGIINIPDWFKE